MPHLLVLWILLKILAVRTAVSRKRNRRASVVAQSGWYKHLSSVVQPGTHPTHPRRYQLFELGWLACNLAPFSFETGYNLAPYPPFFRTCVSLAIMAYSTSYEADVDVSLQKLGQTDAFLIPGQLETAFVLHSQHFMDLQDYVNAGIRLPDSSQRFQVLHPKDIIHKKFASLNKWNLYDVSRSLQLFGNFGWIVCVLMLEWLLEY